MKGPLLDIDLLLAQLTELKAKGVVRVFGYDSINQKTLDLIEVQIDSDGDGQLLLD